MRLLKYMYVPSEELSKLILHKFQENNKWTTEQKNAPKNREIHIQLSKNMWSHMNVW